MNRNRHIHPLHIQGITCPPPRRNHKRTNPAAVLLALIIGLLVGWLLRDGGALLP